MTKNKNNEKPTKAICHKGFSQTGLDQAAHFDYIKCPFCFNKIKSKPGKTSCPDCSTEFEIDDRGECIFINTSKPRLTINGNVCMSCGLVQGEDNMNCLYCGARLSGRLQ